MSNVDDILGRFIDAWNAGERPDVDAYLAGAIGDAERDELAAGIATWLQIAPTPDYDDAARAAIAQEPALQSALEQAELLRAPLSQRLPVLRRRAGLATREVAARLVAVFGLDDERRATDYLQRVERDELDPRRLSRRLLDALATILGADRDELAPPAIATAGSAFFRSDEDADEWIAEEIDALSRAALAPAPSSTPMDELDRLFLGGRDG